VAVAEALAHCIPAVVSQSAPWPELEAEGCGWWVKHDLPSLTQALNAAMSAPAELLEAMGRKGRLWMERDFVWRTIADRMASAYRWRLEGGGSPEWVRVS